MRISTRRIIPCIVLAILGCAKHKENAGEQVAAGPPTTPEKAVRQEISLKLKVAEDDIPMDRAISEQPLKADELDLIEMIMDLEDRQGIEIPDSSFEQYVGNKARDLIKITPNQLIAIVKKSPKSNHSKSPQSPK